nr:synaptobrevin, longin-like domain protein [Tanacetum cinerariifolium]
MEKLAFCDYHNMVAILEKTEHNTNFHQIVDFLEASHIRYAWTIRPIFYVSHIRQFWSTARVETTDGETKILAQVNDMQRTVFESSIRRHLKLNDKEGISTFLGNELFENLSLMGYNILSNQRFSFQKVQFSHQWKLLIYTIMQCLSPKSTSFNEFSSNIATALVCLATNRTYNFFKMIFDGMMRNVKSKGKFLMYPRTVELFASMLVPQDETVFPTGDVRYGEAFPTDSSLDAGQDRENIAKTSVMPHEALPRVTSLVGGEGREDLLDIEKSADKGSDSTDEMSHVLGSLGAENTLASRGLRLVFITASLSVATANTDISFDVATASGSFPTAIILPLPVKKDKGKGKMTKPEQPSKEKRDSKIARIHAEKELEMMIAELDRSNEMVAKYSSEYEQAEAELLHDEKVELIDELLMYHRNLTQIKKYQAQQNKPATKTKRRNFYMSIPRSNAVWEKMQDSVPMNSKLESKRLKRPRIQLDKERIKKLKTTDSSEDMDKLWSLVKETCSTTEVTDEKAKEIWVELKRLYEPDSKDPL